MLLHVVWDPSSVCFRITHGLCLDNSHQSLTVWLYTGLGQRTGLHTSWTASVFRHGFILLVAPQVRQIQVILLPTHWCPMPHSDRHHIIDLLFEPYPLWMNTTAELTSSTWERLHILTCDVVIICWLHWDPGHSIRIQVFGATMMLKLKCVLSQLINQHANRPERCLKRINHTKLAWCVRIRNTGPSK